MKKQFAVVATLVIALGLSVQTARADMTLLVSDGTTTLTVVDNGVGDLSPIDGYILVSDAFGNWTIGANGASTPFIGNSSSAEMHLNTFDVSSRNGGSLLVALSDTGLSLDVAEGTFGTMTSSLGGVTAGSVSAKQIFDPDNNLWGNGGDAVTADHGTFSTSAFSDIIVKSVGPLDEVFSLTELILVVHEGAGSTSVDFQSTVVPVPGAVLLGLLGLGVAGRKLRKRA